ncbi:carbohydrate ABC transporter permease [Jiangella alba]|uniref:Carbohydrate ABC transporter membrane protein 1, CUT1 family n=1 Tax=Jiangella alba TaxID=561176 RepID=A0A1H5JIF3_9ACTN|nr:sugar ABC transporter permease [Jiangella alba]SEE52027.1 carbohydrate ABC transporter membrane protein 1, CUT1 family [Jiangella alba]
MTTLQSGMGRERRSSRALPAPPSHPPRRSRLAARLRRDAWNWVFLTPMIVLFAGFTLWPMAASWYYSFFDWDGIGTTTDWIGWDNYTEVLGSDAFWNAFKNSFIFSLVAIFVQMPLALLFALLLNKRKLYGRDFYRLLIFLPVVTTTAVVGIVFAVMLDPAGGFVNEVLENAGLIDSPINFLGSESTALPTLLSIDLWKGFGVTLIYWLAALQTVPDELYEAGRMDGANGWQTLRHITIPVILPLGIVILLLTFQSSQAPFDLIQATTQGGPNLSTDVLSTYIYRYAFDPENAASRYGFASAVGVVFGAFTLLLTLLQAPLLKRRRTVSAQ